MGFKEIVVIKYSVSWKEYLANVRWQRKCVFFATWSFALNQASGPKYDTDQKYMLCIPFQIKGHTAVQYQDVPLAGP